LIIEFLLDQIVHYLIQQQQLRIIFHVAQCFAKYLLIQRVKTCTRISHSTVLSGKTEESSWHIQKH